MVGTSSSRGAATVLASVFWHLSVACFLSGDAADCLVTEAVSLGVGLAGGAIDLVEVVEAVLEAGLVGSVIVDVTVVVAEAEVAAAAGLLWARC